jgi:hypothetical protein
VGCSSPASSRASTVLPLPLRPTRPVRRWSKTSDRLENSALPSGRTKETSSSTS